MYGLVAHRGFKSPSLCHLKEVLIFKPGDKVRAFTIIPNTWILAEILNYGEKDSFVLIREWYGIEKNSIFKIENKMLEKIAGN